MWEKRERIIRLEVNEMYTRCPLIHSYRPSYIFAGLPYYHKMTQHTVPKYMNKWFKENFFHGYDYNEARDFLSRWREKKRGKDYAAIQ